MNTPLQELINKSWSEAHDINRAKGKGGVNAAEALEWLANYHLMKYVKESSHTEEIAKLIDSYWKFDNNQQPISSWHDKQDLLKLIRNDK